MILALSNNFKLSLNNGEKYISVADSIRRIEEYMKLQNMRYQDRFELHIEVQPEIMVNKIISFILPAVCGECDVSWAGTKTWKREHLGDGKTSRKKSGI